MPPTAVLFQGDSLSLLESSPEAGRRTLGVEPSLILGDVKEVRKAGSFRADACISDPPYGFDFSGLSDKKWDTFKLVSRVKSPVDDARTFQKWTEAWAYPLLRDVLFPGSAIAMFGMDRAIHRAVCGLEDAGFEIRHGFVWLYATGQVKQKHNLRPALEPFIIGRVPLPNGTTDGAYVKKTGRGQLNCEELAKEDGRHPSNVVVEDGLLVPENFPEEMDPIDRALLTSTPFYYVPKPSAKEREMGLEDCALHEKESFRFAHQRKAEEEAGRNMVHNHHPTVKPIALMRRIIRLCSQPGHTIIDPFMGSGSTGIAAILEGRNFIGIEREPDFFQLASDRIRAAHEGRLA